MKKFKVILFTISLFSAVSCSTVKTRTMNVMKITNTGVIQKQVLVDLIVDENKVTGIAKESKGVDIEIVKNNAIYDALKKVNADILIEPTFEIEQSFQETKVTVVGYPGKYKNFRPITLEEMPLLDLNKNEPHKAIIPIKKGKK
jgi:hypothetical protein